MKGKSYEYSSHTPAHHGSLRADERADDVAEVCVILGITGV